MPERPLAVVAAWRWWTGLALVSAVAGYLTILAYSERLPAVFRLVPQFDKGVHFSIAGLLAGFLDGALRRRALFAASRFPVSLAAALVLVPAGIEEYLQRYATSRTSSIWDFAADVAGVVVLVSVSRRVAQ
jgi:VanZ family protein